jgi:phenylpropionate dioxygenase-like ring-hydroxylating dioxygenase large terminal subunit
MSFNSSIVKSYAGGALTAFTAPLASYKGSLVALNGVTAGTAVSTVGLVLQAGGANNIEFNSLAALVETNITTSTMTVTTKWQVSNDGTSWIDLFEKTSQSNTNRSAAGTGSLVTTQYVQSMDGINPSFPYMRIAVQVGVATGAAGDNVTVSYNWRKRFIGAIG